jgi:hypothetical protein
MSLKAPINFAAHVEVASMKSFNSDPLLRPSDLVRAERVPGFQDAMPSTSVRVTRSGWSACCIDAWKAPKSKGDHLMEHRFSDSEIADLDLLLARLAVEEPKPITCDDVPVQQIYLMREDSAVRLEAIEFKKKKFAAIARPSPAFLAVWSFVHAPFKEFIESHVNQRI